MLKRLIHFVQYHNFFTIAVMFLFLGASATFAANPEAVIQKTETVRSVDNTFVVNTDFDAFNPELKILSVVEDSGIYYVAYSYLNIEVVDYVWQTIPVEGTMKVSKKELAGRDLGLFVASQLGQVVDLHIGYLKDVQKREREKGASQKVVAVEYSGLVGRFLDDEEKVFDGYTPVKPPEVVVRSEPVAQVAAVSEAVPNNGVSTVSYGAPPKNGGAITREEAQRLIQEAVRQALAGGGSVATSTPSTGSETPTSSTGGGGTTSSTTPSTETPATGGATTGTATSSPETTPTEPTPPESATTTPPTTETPPPETATTTPPTTETPPPTEETPPPTEPDPVTPAPTEPAPTEPAQTPPPTDPAPAEETPPAESAPTPEPTPEPAP